MFKIDLTNFHVAVSLAPRDISRRIVFNLIRSYASMLSVDLGRESGVEPSPVSMILRSESDPPRIFYNQDCGVDNRILQRTVWRRLRLLRAYFSNFVVVAN